MKRRILLQRRDGLVAVAFPVDPDLEAGEVEIFPEPTISRTKTPQVDRATLDEMLSRCR